MKQEELKRIIGQIKRYDLVSEFEDVEEVKRWLETLNERQISNFIDLNIDLSNIKFPKNILLNKAFLNHPMFLHRINILMNLDYNNLNNNYVFDTEFLTGNYFDSDIKLLMDSSVDEEIKELLTSPGFVNSSHHQSDLELILKTENKNVRQLLIDLVGDYCFVESPFHEADMNFIASLKDISEDKATMLYGYATDTDVLHDNYRSENMKILVNNKYADELLYALLTNMVGKNITDGKYYRQEIEAFTKALTEGNAIAVFKHIVNGAYYKDSELFKYYFDKFGFDFSLEYLTFGSYTSLDKYSNPNYLKELELLATVDEKITLFVERLMSWGKFIANPNFEFDLNLLESLANSEEFNSEIFADVFRVMKFAPFSPYHQEDLMIIKNEQRARNRELMVQIATHRYNYNSINHEYDMNFGRNLDFELLTEEQITRIINIMMIPQNIYDSNHITLLEQVLNNNFVSENNDVLTYLNELERNPKLLQYEPSKKGSMLRRIRNGFKDEL